MIIRDYSVPNIRGIREIRGEATQITRITRIIHGQFMIIRDYSAPNIPREREKNGNSASVSRVLFLTHHYWRTSLLPFIYYASRPASLAFYPPPYPRKEIGREALKRWYTWTCSPQMVQPDDCPSAGGLLHTPSHPYHTQGMAVVFFYRHLPSPTASIFGSGVPYAARTFLSCAQAQQRQNRGTVSIKMQSYCKKLD